MIHDDLIGFVYYVESLDALCIHYPGYVDSATGFPALEWGPDERNYVSPYFKLNAKELSHNKNAEYLGPL